MPQAVFIESMKFTRQAETQAARKGKSLGRLQSSPPKDTKQEMLRDFQEDHGLPFPERPKTPPSISCSKGRVKAQI